MIRTVARLRASVPGKACLTAGMVLSIASTALAQRVTDAAALPTGTRVRLAYRALAGEEIAGPPKPVIGELMGVHGDSIDVLTDQSSRVARFLVPNLDHIDYSRGEYHPLVRALVIGTGLGATLGYAFGSQVARIPCTTCTPHPGREGALMGAGVGLVGGALVGWLIRVDRWSTITLR